MFCPKCGKADQVPETFCRQCGTFLPDLNNPKKKEVAPEEHIKVNSVLSIMTVIVSFVLAGLLYGFLGFRSETHWLIYLTAGFLIAMGGWHIQTFIRMRRLKKQWQRRSPDNDAALDELPPVKVSTAKLLEQPDFSDLVPPSVTDQTTKHLAEPQKRSS